MAKAPSLRSITGHGISLKLLFPGVLNIGKHIIEKDTLLDTEINPWNLRGSGSGGGSRNDGGSRSGGSSRSGGVSGSGCFGGC